MQAISDGHVRVPNAFAAVMLVFLVLCGLAMPCGAQTGTQATPSFEVASVRRVEGATGYTSISPRGAATFVARRASLRLLLEIAFSVNDDQIESKLKWLDSLYYDVQAKSADGKAISDDDLQPMMQHLLESRFGLVFHRETKMVSGYALTRGGSDPKLQSAPSQPDAMAYILANGLRSPSVSMHELASLLSRPLGKPVEDRTGISGSYKLDLTYAPAEESDSPLPSVFTAVQEQLGLKLVPQKVSIQMLVIEKADKIPSAD